ncbi:unnamed protein product, partial [Staurois parvus]
MSCQSTPEYQCSPISANLSPSVPLLSAHQCRLISGH